MKTPEKIKEDAEICLNHPLHETCNHCRLYNECDGMAEHIIKELYDLVLQVERERDAAVHDMENYCHHGSICKHFCDGNCPYPIEGCPLYPSDCESYEWRGVCPENTTEDEP